MIHNVNLELPGKSNSDATDSPDGYIGSLKAAVKLCKALLKSDREAV